MLESRLEPGQDRSRLKLGLQLVTYPFPNKRIGFIHMKSSRVHLTYHIELQPGEQLRLPDALVANVSEGRWLLTVQAANDSFGPPLRSHTAFLNGYAPEDEGLYDADPAR